MRINKAINNHYETLEALANNHLQRIDKHIHSYKDLVAMTTEEYYTYLESLLPK